MYSKILVSLTALIIPSLSFAETANNFGINPLKQLNNVRVSMQRMVKSIDGNYFMSLYAGIANPHATLYNLKDQSITEFRGTQKGNQLNLFSINTDPQQQNFEQVQLNANLNVNSGILQGSLLTPHNLNAETVQFEPAFKVVNKPLFTFKFYGVKADTQAQEQLLTRVDVMNKTTNTIAQTLTGFSAYPGSIGYMDVNFDGYYDVILSDLSRERKVTDKRYIYWMYNPKTKQFQRSPQLEKIVGFPNLNGITQQINFGEGQVYQVEKGLLSRIETSTP